MRKLARWLPLSALLGSVSCAFLLDFDELGSETGDGHKDASSESGGSGGTGGGFGGVGGSSGTGGKAGDSGTGASGGNGGTGGTAGSDASDADDGDGGPVTCTTPGVTTECDDNDACTVDVCVIPDAGGLGQCGHFGELLDDGQIDLPVVPWLGGVTVAGIAGHFYVSYYHTPPGDGGAPFDTALVDVTTQGALAVTKTVLLSQSLTAQAPRGPAGLVHDGAALHAFVAGDPSSLTWRVVDVAFANDLTSPVATEVCGNCYGGTLDGTRHPMAYLGPDGKPKAVWGGPEGLWFGGPSAKPTAKTISAADVTAVSPVISETTEGALWRDKTSVQLSMVGGKSAPIDVCFPSAPAGFQGLGSAGRGRLWSSHVTHNPGASTEFGSYIVTGDQWTAFATCKQGGDQIVNGLLAPDLAAFQRPPAAATERLQFASAGIVAANKGVFVNANYIELTAGKFELAALGQFEMKGTETLPLAGSALVDSVAVAYADEKLLLAWRDTQGLLGNTGTVRLRRFKYSCP